MMSSLFSLCLVLFAFFCSSSGIANDRLAEWLIKKELSKKFGGSRIALLGNIQWIKGGPPLEPVRVSILKEDGQGHVSFVLNRLSHEGESPVGEGAVSVGAWVPARIAQKRIRPGESLQKEDFTLQEINVLQGGVREYRGLILSPDVDLSRLESIQTILEGQPLLSSEVKKIPDVRRGDFVRIQILSGNLNVMTQGIAIEPAYLNHTVKVLAGKYKKELTGKLQLGSVVEVRL
jgi:flagella basal body P-ring formation protein FlgA